MDKLSLLNYLKEEKIVAVIRGNSKEEVIKSARALKAGGINFLEITFTTPNALDIIKELAAEYQADASVVVGAGTCLDVETARMAIVAGAQFIVAPHFDKEIIKLCNTYRVPVFPGATTVKDMVDCLRYGADVIKLFPGNIYGPQGIKSFKGPLPQAEFMPTGGVGLENIADWLAQGAIAVGVGGSLLADAATGDYQKVTEKARQYVQAVAAYEQ